MKKNKKFGIAILTLAVVAILLGQPLSFDPLTEDCTSLSMTYIDMTLDNNGPDARSKTYTFWPEDKAFGQVQEILSRYSYHRSLITYLFGEFGNKNDIGYQLILSFDCEGKELQPVALISSGQIFVSNYGYRMSSKQAVAMMEEIRQVIGAENLP